MSRRPDSSALRVPTRADCPLQVPPAELPVPVWVAANSRKLERKGAAAAPPEQPMGRDDPASLMAPSALQAWDTIEHQWDLSPVPRHASG